MRNLTRLLPGTGPFSGIAGWVALLTALVCALVPLGSGQARAAGSAFDPTNSIVVLSPRGPHIGAGERPALRKPRQQQRADVPMRMARYATAPAPGPQVAARAPLRFAAAEAPPPPAWRVAALGARAPPLA